jgi:hypothetical protein
MKQGDKNAGMGSDADLHERRAQCNTIVIPAHRKGTGGGNTPFCVTDTAMSELFSTEKAAPSTETGDHTTITKAQFSTSRASFT